MFHCNDRNVYMFAMYLYRPCGIYSLMTLSNVTYCILIFRILRKTSKVLIMVRILTMTCSMIYLREFGEDILWLVKRLKKNSRCKDWICKAIHWIAYFYYSKNDFVIWVERCFALQKNIKKLSRRDAFGEGEFKWGKKK